MIQTSILCPQTPIYQSISINIKYKPQKGIEMVRYKYNHLFNKTKTKHYDNRI